MLLRRSVLGGRVLKAYLGQIILGACILLAVFIHAKTTRYQAISAGGSAYVVDHWTGKIK